MHFCKTFIEFTNTILVINVFNNAHLFIPYVYYKKREFFKALPLIYIETGKASLI